jgi:type VI secretion system secreted protein Hcp
MAVDYFLKLDGGIQGESVNDKHKNEIQILSFSWGGTQVSSVAGTGGSGAGKVQLENFSIMKTFDKASVPLFKALVSGAHIPNGVVTACKAGGGGNPYITVKFKELFVTSYQVSGSSEVPTESVSFSYNEVNISYSTQDEKGVLTQANQTTYNVAQNKPS